MTGTYRKYEITVLRDATTAYFLVISPNGTKLTSGVFSPNNSLIEKYQELRTRIDMNILENQ